jgi:DDE family transposase
MLICRKQMFSTSELHRHGERSLSISEIMTILIHFHQSHYRDFKAYYTDYVLERLRGEFPGLVSYTRFVEFIPSVLLPLCVYLRTKCFGICTGISFIDSTSVTVCQNPRIHSPKVFSEVAERGKTSTGWFFGFKLHLAFNDQGKLLNLGIWPALIA